MAEDYVLQTKITADSTEFQNAIKGVSNSLNGIKKSLTEATDNIKKGTANWGLDLDKFYDKGSGIFKSFGVDIDKFASHFGVSGKLVTAITVATVALTKFGQSMNGARAELAKGTGAIGEDLIKLQDTFHKAMIEGIGRDAKEVGGMMADLNTRFGATEEELVAMTVEFDKFAEVMGVDARQAINTTADIMAKWGLETEKLSPLLDQLTTASQMSGATIDELTNGLKQGQAVFSQFGMSATDSIAMLSSFAKNGLETTTAINSMRFALNTFSKEGIDAKKGLEETTEAIKTASSETEALSIASSVFGSKNGAEMVKVLKSGALSADDFKTALINAGGALEATDKASRTSVDALADLKATLTGTFAGFGEGFDNLFRDLIDSIKEVVKFIAPVIEPIGNIFRDVFSAIGQMLKILVDNFIEFQKRYNTVFSAVTSVIQTVYETIHKVLSNIVEMFGTAFSFIFAILDGKWGLAWEYAKKQALLFSKSISDILSGIVNLFAKMINGVIENLNSAINLYHKLPKSVQIFDIQNIDKISESIDLASKWNITGKLAETQQKIDELTGKTSEKIIGDLGKVKEVSTDVSDTMKSEAMEVSQISIDWSNKLLQQEIAVLEKEREDAVNRAKLEEQSEREIFDIKKSYADKIYALQVKQIEAQREAEIKKVKASNESLESQKDLIAKINKYYDTQKSLIKDSTSFIEKSDKVIKESSNSWDAWIKSFEDKANDWTTMTVEMAKVGMDSIGSMFDQIGQDLVNGGSGFENYASIAVDAISQVLKALASQITALAVVAIGEKNYAKATYLMAGATTALVASSALKAVSNTMKDTSSAIENATNNIEDFTEKLKSLWSDSSSTSAVLSSMLATDSAIKFITDDTSKLNLAMSKQEIGVKDLIYSLQNQSEETQSLYEEYKLLYESLNKYNAEVKRSGNIIINYAKIVRKELIANSKELLNEVYSDFGNYGAKIGEALMDSLLSSATESDYLETMKDYIKKQMLQLAVYTESFTDEIADIGLKLIDSITNDGSGIDIVTKRLSDLFEKTSAVAEKIDETIDNSFAKIDSLATEAVSRLNELKSSLSELRNETTQGLNSFVSTYTELNNETYTYMKQSENVYTQNIKNLDDALSEYNSALSDLEERT
jgi:phage-related minor tail protein